GAMAKLLKTLGSRFTTGYRAIVNRKRDGACKAAKDRIRNIRQTMDFFDKRRVHVFLYDDVLRVVADTLADVIKCRCRQTRGCCGYLSQREIAELEQLIPTIKSKFLKVAGFLLDHRRISLLRYWVKTKYTDMYLGKKAIEQKDFEAIMGKA